MRVFSSSDELGKNTFMINTEYKQRNNFVHKEQMLNRSSYSKRCTHNITKHNIIDFGTTNGSTNSNWRACQNTRNGKKKNNAYNTIKWFDREVVFLQATLTSASVEIEHEKTIISLAEHNKKRADLKADRGPIGTLQHLKKENNLSAATV